MCGTNVTSPPCCAALPRCDVQGGLNGRYLGNPPGGGCARAAERGLASWGSPWDRTGWGRLRSLASAERFGFAGFLDGTPRSGLASLGPGISWKQTFRSSWADCAGGLNARLVFAAAHIGSTPLRRRATRLGSAKRSAPMPLTFACSPSSPITANHADL